MDLPSLRIEDAVAPTGSVDARVAKKKDRIQIGPAAMSHIYGVKRPLTHTNSFTGERVPVHGVETPHEEQLGKVFSFKFSNLHRLNIYFKDEQKPLSRNYFTNPLSAFILCHIFLNSLQQNFTNCSLFSKMSITKKNNPVPSN